MPAEWWIQVLAAMRVAIADTGPLMALLDRAERHHAWVVERVAELEAPPLVCEPVLAGAMFLLARLPKAQEALWELSVYRKHGREPLTLIDPS